MSSPEELQRRHRLAWLILIGQRLKQQYDAIAKPLPTPLALLLQRLEARADPDSAAEQDAMLRPGRTTATPPQPPGDDNTSTHDRDR